MTSLFISAPGRTRSSPSALWALLAALLALRLVAAGLIPLTEDEAYYRLWSLFPRAGYYDHPPMIAWWMAAGRATLGDDGLGLRAPAVLSGLVSTLLVFDLARRAGEPRSGLRAAVWFNAMPLIGLGGFLATPDAPETLFWAATIWALSRLEGENPAPWWLAAGAFAGLALLSKYSGFFLLGGVGLWLVATPTGRRWLPTPWPWLGLELALLVFAPNFLWNAGHGWITFAKQFGRVEANGFRPGYLVEAAVAQVLLMSPFLVPFVVRGYVRLRARDTGPGSALTLVGLSTAPLIGYMLLHAMHARVQGNWPSPIYPSLAVLAACAAAPDGGRGAVGVVRRLIVPFGYGLAVIGLAHAAFPQTDVFGRRDPVTQVRGWAELARRVDAVRAAQGASWIGTNSYGTASQLLANGVRAVPVIELSERDRYAFEPIPAALGAAPGLVFDLDRRLKPADLFRCFARVSDLGTLYRQSNGVRIKLYRFYLVGGPRVALVRTGCPALERGSAEAER